MKTAMTGKMSKAVCRKQSLVNANSGMIYGRENSSRTIGSGHVMVDVAVRAEMCDIINDENANMGSSLSLPINVSPLKTIGEVYITMKLYHGTSAAYVEAILRDGIQPRNMTRKSNFEDVAESHSGHVYLTDIYGPLYALQDESGGAIVEIDTECLPEGVFLPDEDYMLCLVHAVYGTGRKWKTLYKPSRRLRNALNKGIKEAKLDHLVDAYVNDQDEGCRPLVEGFRDNIEVFRALWKDSLHEEGTVAYAGVIPPSAICRIALLDSLENAVLYAIHRVDSPSIINHRRSVSRAIPLTEWFFGATVSAEQLGVSKLVVDTATKNMIRDLESTGDPAAIERAKNISERHRLLYEKTKEALEERQGIRVISPPKGMPSLGAAAKV